MAAAGAILLLPARSRFGGQRLATDTGRWLGRGDHRDLPVPTEGVARSLFEIVPDAWPVAAATRQRDAGDAGTDTWLRADPAHVQPDINGARLMAHGDALAMEDDDAARFLQPLRPIFGDAGLPIEAPTATRWYLKVAAGTPLPPMASIEQALGEDMFEHLPAGADGRRWRALLSEAQVALHNHPHNIARAAAGLAAVNSLWFWGAGRLPDVVRTHVASFHSEDTALLAFAELAGADTGPLPKAWPTDVAKRGPGLYDLRDGRDLALLDREWLQPALHALATGALSSVEFMFADGHRVRVARAHRWRFWRPSLHSFIVPGDGAGEA